MTERAGRPIGFVAFLRVGIPVTVVSLLIATGYVCSATWWYRACPHSIVRSVIREVEPLAGRRPDRAAARRVLDSGLPALPAVERDGSFAGIFGEREFMAALFPGYVEELGSAAMVKRSIDDTIEAPAGCRSEPIRDYLTTDHVNVERRLLRHPARRDLPPPSRAVVPIATEGRVHAVVTRSDFFRELVSKFESASG